MTRILTASVSAFPLFLVSPPALAEQVTPSVEAPTENSVDEGNFAPLAFKLVEHRVAGPPPSLPDAPSHPGRCAHDVAPLVDEPGPHPCAGLHPGGRDAPRTAAWAA